MERFEKYSRKDFIRLSLAGGAVAAAGGLIWWYGQKETGPNSIPAVESGETERLSYFEYANQLDGYTILFNEPVLEMHAQQFNFPLRDPSEMKISLLPVTSFSDPPVTDFGYVDVNPNEAHIKFAGKRFIDEVILQTGRPPTDIRDEVFLSTVHSVAMVFGHCQLAAMKQEMSAQEALNKSYRFLDATLDLELTELPSWISISGSPDQPSFDLLAGLRRHINLT